MVRVKPTHDRKEVPMSKVQNFAPTKSFSQKSCSDDDEDFTPPPVTNTYVAPSTPTFTEHKGHVKITVSKFLEIVKKHYDRKDENIPVRYLFRDLNLRGEVKKQFISFDVDLVINVLQQESWVVVPILNKLTNTGIQSYEVKGGGENSFLGIYENRSLALICNGAGTYEISIKLDVAYDSTSSSDRHLSFSIPNASVNRLKLTNTDPNMQIKVDNSLSQEQKEGELECSFAPTHVLKVHMTPMVVVMPPTESMTLEEEEEEKKEVIVPITVTVEQAVSHAIGEGIVQTTAVFGYTIANGSVSETNIIVNTFGRPFKVLNVTGVVKSWDVIDAAQFHDDENEIGDIEEDSEYFGKKVIRVQWEYGQEHNSNIVVTSELEMEGTSCRVRCPSFAVLGITREKGFVAVMARTNVEIQEDARKYLAKIDPSELPSTIHAQFTILHAYKFLESDHMLGLNVTRHDDVEVLSSCISSLDYVLTYTPTSLLHKLNFKLLNTGKQYLRVEVPVCDVWSTTIDGESVKPSSEGEDKRTILIPLTKKGDSKELSGEFVFTAPHTEDNMLKPKGTLCLDLAKFDTPIRYLRVTLFVPKEYRFGEFYGDERIVEVPYFSFNLSTSSTPSYPQHNYNEIMQQNIDRVLERGERIELLQEQTERLQDAAMEFKKSDRGGGFLRGAMNRMRTAGVKPVTLDNVGGVGQQFLFERFLVLETEEKVMQIKVDYKEQTKEFLQKRSLNSINLKTILLVLLVPIIAYFMYRRTF